MDHPNPQIIYKDVEKVVNHHEEDLAKYGYKPVMQYTSL
jgi:hypothetical protein